MRVWSGVCSINSCTSLSALIRFKFFFLLFDAYFYFGKILFSPSQWCYAIFRCRHINVYYQSKLFGSDFISVICKCATGVGSFCNNFHFHFITVLFSLFNYSIFNKVYSNSFECMIIKYWITFMRQSSCWRWPSYVTDAIRIRWKFVISSKLRMNSAHRRCGWGSSNFHTENVNLMRKCVRHKTMRTMQMLRKLLEILKE